MKTLSQILNSTSAVDLVEGTAWKILNTTLRGLGFEAATGSDLRGFKGIAKEDIHQLFGIPMRAGKWADVWFIILKEDGYAVINDEKVTIFDHTSDALKAIQKITVQKKNITEEDTLEESFADIAPVLVGLATNLGILAAGIITPMVMNYFKTDSDFLKASKIISTLASKDSDLNSLMKKVSNFEYKTSPEAKSARRELMTYLKNNVDSSTFNALKGHLYKASKIQGAQKNEAVEKIACLKCDEVSTAAAWAKNKGFCPVCKVSSQGVAESFELEEKLSADDDAGVWISDFVKSTDPRFEGKSKKERIKMALGAYYAAQNEEFETEGAQLDEEVDYYKFKQLAILGLLSPADANKAALGMKAIEGGHPPTQEQKRIIGDTLVLLVNMITGDSAVLNKLKKTARDAKNA